jgi:transcriptional regulator with XRE-family HTH domain
MNRRVSQNLRYLLWREDVARERWAPWLADRTGLALAWCRDLLAARIDDADVGPDQLARLGQAFGHDDGGETLRFADLVTEGCDVLRENLRHLFGQLPHGEKKRAAGALGVDPTTISRWLSGGSAPQTPMLHLLRAQFALPEDVDLRTAPVFLTSEPLGAIAQRRWLHERLDALTSTELRSLFPALRRLLEER